MGILEKLCDLHKQATEERSHYYTGKIILEAIHEISTLRRKISEQGEAETQPLTQQGSEPSEISAFVNWVASLSRIQYSSNDKLAEIIEKAQKLLPC